MLTSSIPTLTEDRKFKDVDQAIEKKRKTKILLITSQVNTLDLLEMFDKNNLFIKYSRDVIEVKSFTKNEDPRRK